MTPSEIILILTADFMTRRWEGNVRERENLIIRGILFSTEDEIRTVDVSVVTHAAKQCGLERQALQQIMRRYAIKADAFRR